MPSTKYITLETAPDLLGKTVDCFKRRFHYYPLRITKLKNDGRYCVVDRNDVWMPLREDDRIPFDFVVKDDDDGIHKCSKNT